VTFQVDADGLLSVTAREATTGVEASVAVKPSYGLADGEIERMLRESFEHAREDMHSRALHEAQVEANRLIEAVRSALAADSALLEASEREEIERRVAALEGALGGADHRALRAGTEALNKATDEFAARRMDAGVRRALAGRRIANLDV